MSAQLLPLPLPHQLPHMQNSCCCSTALPNCADVEYEDNLKYFLEFGVRPGDGCDYLVVVQQARRLGAAVEVVMDAAV